MNDSTITIIVGGVLSAITAILAFLTVIIKGKVEKVDNKVIDVQTKTQALEVKVDGRLTQLLEMTKEAFELKGREIGHAKGVADADAKYQIALDENAKAASVTKIEELEKQINDDIAKNTKETADNTKKTAENTGKPTGPVTE